ncbi:hypothetical protein N9J72_02885 [Candidatus Gracilibacteria bacterium]|nr:hypothetical protein [Candidatus Gracilibacteria bacterium]
MSNKELYDDIENIDIPRYKNPDIHYADKKPSDLRGRRYSLDTWSRVGLTLWVGIVIPSYLYIVLELVYLSSELNISDSVLTVLLTTTTFNILGMMYIVLRGYFNVKD